MKRLAASLGLVLSSLAACSTPATTGGPPAQDVSDIGQKAKVCFWYIAGSSDANNGVANGSRISSSDDGWCTANTTFSFNGINTSPTISISVQPQHGTVQTLEQSGGVVEIAYRPSPGYSGLDAFTVHAQHDLFDTLYPFAVTAGPVANLPDGSQAIILPSEPPNRTLAYGQSVIALHSSCPAGQNQIVTGGKPTLNIPRHYACIPAVSS